jgi:SAM-dependent methyltransferase
MNASLQRKEDAVMRRGAIYVRQAWWVARTEGLRAGATKAVRALAALPAELRSARAERAFDEAHGVDTRGIVRLGALRIDSPNRSQGVRYEASAPSVFRALVGAIPGDLADFVFVDMGSGKGRVVLLASEYPFRRVVGVEFSPELDAVARANVEALRRQGRGSSIELVCADATAFAFPDEPLVLYFFNPFAPEVMREVLQNLADSLARAPRPAFVLLTGAGSLANVAQEFGFAHVDGATDGRSGVYRFAADSAT